MKGKGNFLSVHFMGASFFATTEGIWESGLACYGLTFKHQSNLSWNVIFGLYILDYNMGRTIYYLDGDCFC